MDIKIGSIFQHGRATVANARVAKALPQQGHALIDVMMGVAVLALMLASLYAGFTSGFALLQVARENLRATQILEERMEIVRLIRWADVATGFIPSTFTVPYDASGPTNVAPNGLTYYGTVTVTNAPVLASYSDHLRMIQIDLTWTSGNVARKRQMSTYVSEFGLQNYIY
jgi:hypothetical protein